MDIEPEIVQTLKVDSNLEYYMLNKNEEPLRLSGSLILKSIKFTKIVIIPYFIY